MENIYKILVSEEEVEMEVIKDFTTEFRKGLEILVIKYGKEQLLEMLQETKVV